MEQPEALEASPEPGMKTIGGSTSQAPLKTRIRSIQSNIGQAQKDLQENKKEMQLLRSECATLEAKNKEQTNEILKEILEDIANLDKDFKKLVEMDNNEVAFLQQQLFQLN